MYIFSFSPRNQLPNHGLRVGDKDYWEMVPATSSTSLAPQFFAVEPADWPGSGGRRQVLLEDGNHHFKQQARCLSSSPRNQLQNLGLTAATSITRSQPPPPPAAAWRLRLCYRVCFTSFSEKYKFVSIHPWTC